MPYHRSLPLLILWALAGSAALAAQTGENSPGSVVPVRAIEAFANLPLYFEPNQGQTERQVKFLSRGAGHTLFLTPSKAVLLLTRREPGPIERWDTPRRGPAPPPGEGAPPLRAPKKEPERTRLKTPQQNNSSCLF